MTLRITDIDDGMARFIEERSRTLRFKDEAEYLRSLIHEDMTRAGGSDIDSILGPVHRHSEAQGYTDEALAEVFDKARNEVARARQA